MTSFVFNKPIIATSVGAFKEVITNKENGIIIKHNSPEELADAIFQVFTDVNLYSTLQIGVMEFCTNHPKYDWNSIANKTAHVFKKYLDK